MLETFKGVGRAKNVKLKWRTGTELNVLGFNVWRSDTRDGTFARSILIKLLWRTPARPRAPAMLYKDKSAEPGKKYFYKVQVVLQGDSEWSNTVKVRKPPSH